jgi:nicotinamide-nucleotide amidase
MVKNPPDSIVEVINTGSELMLGRVLNTHQQWLCRQLADRGYVVSRQTAVPDSALAIQEAVREALSRADLVITTGGLGPTSDDITRTLVAELLGRKLRRDARVLARITAYYRLRKRVMPEVVRVQADVPDGAQVLPNANGTAPGLAMRLDPNPFRSKAALLVMLPGPTRELRPMFEQQVTTLLRRKLPLKRPFVCRTLRTIGIPESIAQERIAGPLTDQVNAGLEIGYCARVGEVDVRLSSRRSSSVGILNQAERRVREILGEAIYGQDDDELARVVLGLLTRRKQTLTVAESCTGGGIANCITNVPGASAVFLGGFVVYSNEWKRKLLGVRAETLARHGAVSEPVCREMAQGARRRTGADFALSVTGVAGPGGGTTHKPVGTVFIGLADSKGVSVTRHLHAFDRETFKYMTVQQSLNRLRLCLMQGG